MRSIAKSGSATAPITSTPGSALSTPVITCRTTAESSMTMTLMRFTGPAFASRLAVNRRRDGVHAVVHTMQALGMPNEQPATGLQHRQHALYNLALRLCIEIDEHVTQEDHVEGADVRQRLVQIHLQELHLVPQ